MSRILAFDQSLSNTGVCRLITDTAQQYSTQSWKPPKEMVNAQDGARLSWFYEKTFAALREFKPNVVTIEGYSYGSAFRLAELGELGGVIRLACFRCDKGIQIITISPRSLKLWGTGDGKANKPMMKDAAIKIWGDVIKDADQADATWLANMTHNFLIGSWAISTDPELAERQREAMCPLHGIKYVKPKAATKPRATKKAA